MSHQQSFSYKGTGLPGLNKYYARINVLAQGHNACKARTCGPSVSSQELQSNLSYPNVDYPKLLGYSKTMDSPDFFPIIYCNKTTYYLNFHYPKKSIFRSDSSVPIKENAIKLPFKIRSPNVTHGDHDFFVWSSSIYTSE